MNILDSPRQRAGILIVVLGLALLIALSPYVVGLLAVPVLYVVCSPLHRRLTRYVSPELGAAMVCAALILGILVPGSWLVSQVIAQAPGALTALQEHPALAQVGNVHIGPISVGPQLAKAGSAIGDWASSAAFGVAESLALGALNLFIALLGLSSLLIASDRSWAAVEGVIPFSPGNADLLRQRFYSVTHATLLGTAAGSALIGTLIGISFAIVGLTGAVFWGVIAGVVSIIPVVGSALVWIPAAGLLALEHRYGAAGTVAGIAILGGVIVDNVLRPLAYRRFSNIHPLVTVLGALAGIRYVGLLGLLLGPLAISYFFECLRLYGQEYGGEEARRTTDVVATAADGVTGSPSSQSAYTRVHP